MKCLKPLTGEEMKYLLGGSHPGPGDLDPPPTNPDGDKPAT